MDVVFLCLVDTDEIMTTLLFFDAMHKAGGVKQLVYISACGDFVSQKGVVDLMQSHTAMHVLIKSTIEQKLAYGGYAWKTTVLGPTLFFTNDFQSKRSLLEDGYFDTPLGSKGASRVSTADIALATRNIILNPSKWAGKKIMIGSLKKFTGAEVAVLWSQALGREIKMWGSDCESMTAFKKHFARKTGRDADWGRDLRLMYETFEVEGFGMSEREYEVQVELLGREPEDYEAWVRKVGEGWR